MTTTQKLIKTLTDYNKWRREGGEVMPNPADIGKAIDDAIAALSAQAELEASLTESLHTQLELRDRVSEFEVQAAIPATKGGE